MAESANGRYGKYYWIDSSSSKDVLTSQQMQANVRYIFSCIKDKYPSWSLNAISAICGNMQSEGALNPSQWEYGRNKSTKWGYGLCQWTPATKLLEWLNANGKSRLEIDPQIERLEFERSTGIQYYKTSAYNLTFSQFLASSEAVAYLAGAWLYNYERPKDPAATLARRQAQAENWYKFLSGEEPEPPNPNPGPSPKPDPVSLDRNLKIWMYPCFRKR